MKTHTFHRLAFSATYLAALGLLMSGLAAQTAAQAGSAAPRRFAVEGDRFALDGKPFRSSPARCIIRGFRGTYWRDRLRMAKAMGLNTIKTYVFWNVHEPAAGRCSTSPGNLDVAEFIREAQQEGPLCRSCGPAPMFARNGSLAAIPAWLLKDPKWSSAASDPKFHRRCALVHSRLGQELAPLQIGNGGPDHRGASRKRIRLIRRRSRLHGADPSDARSMPASRRRMLYTADGADELTSGSLPELPAVINFGPGDAKRAFAHLKKFRPNGPFMNGEYWDGWFDHWGAKHAHHRYRPAGPRPGVDARPGLLGQHLHVSRRHQLRLDERRQQQRQRTMSRMSPAMTTIRRWTKAGAPQRNTRPCARPSAKPPASLLQPCRK